MPTQVYWLKNTRHCVSDGFTPIMCFKIAAVLYCFYSVIVACDIPDIDPFDKTILEFIHEPEVFECSSHDPLTYTSLEEGRQVLRIKDDVVHHYKTSKDQLDCCYSVITRENEDLYKESDCHKFSTEANLEYDVEFIYVKCLETNTRVELYKNMHAVVQINPPHSHIPDCDTQTTDTGDRDKNLPNVLLVGLDSISRLNLKRTMPKTVAHLLATNWVELNKYNKVADNTYPNVMAILTGKNEKQLFPIKCFANPGTWHDHCPFIWKDFKQKGYKTAYVEDDPEGNTFNWDKNYHGFDHQPTDYYLRPFVIAAEKKLPKIFRFRYAVCLGPVSTTDIILKYTKDLLGSFRDSLFAITWLNNLSHNNLNLPAFMDDTFLKFIEDLSTSETLNNTFVIFLSDHGIRFGAIRATYVGWLEERLPFIYIWVPEWFRKRNPTAYQNLVDNGHRLTSPYDLHLTLKELVDGSFGENKYRSEACPTCASLFNPLPKDRSCDDAGVPPHWCACARSNPVATVGNIVPKAAQFAVDHIMEKLSTLNNSTYSPCVVLQLNTIVNARLKEKSGNVSYDDYVVVFKTEPGLALFDATIRHWSSIAKQQFEIIGLISRINAYGNQSACISNERILKMYCFCG